MRRRPGSRAQTRSSRRPTRGMTRLPVFRRYRQRRLMMKSRQQNREPGKKHRMQRTGTLTRTCWRMRFRHCRLKAMRMMIIHLSAIRRTKDRHLPLPAARRTRHRHLQALPRRKRGQETVQIRQFPHLQLRRIPLRQKRLPRRLNRRRRTDRDKLKKMRQA